VPYVFTEDKKRIWYDVVGAGEPLVLIGGSSLVHRQWDFLLPRLKDSFKIILYDQRGAGLSDRSTGGISVDQWADDLKRVLDEVKVPRARFLGTSNGSLVVIRFAAKYPDRTGPVIHYGMCRLTEQYRKMSRIGATIVEEFGVGDGGMGAYFLMRMFGTPPSIEKWVTDRFEENLSSESWKAMHQALDVDLTDDLRKIEVPQLILMGEKGPLGQNTDYASGFKDLQRLCLHAETAVITGSEGTFHVMTHPKAVADVVLSFLKRHPL
jgi:pimeloyl-ACP methyl ester carboxylesterase